MHYPAPGQEPEFILEVMNEDPIRLSDCRVIWWRRPQHFVIPSNVTNQSYRQFAYNESHEAFAGLWNAVNAFWVNPPNNDAVAHHKAYQLNLARDIGLRVPQTLITNNPKDAARFVEHQGAKKTIYKAFSATEQDWRETRVLRSEELSVLENVQYAPVIFQEYIDAAYDLRITVVGDKIFPAAIFSQETAYKVDFRMDIGNAKIEAVTLPLEVEERLHELMSRLGLIYGAIDMRLTPNGDYVFLEINPAGQWLFIEQKSRQPITLAMATLLASKDQT